MGENKFRRRRLMDAPSCPAVSQSGNSIEFDGLTAGVGLLQENERSLPSCPAVCQSTISIESSGLTAGVGLGVLILIPGMILLWIFASRTCKTQKRTARCSLNEAELIV